MFSYNYKTGNIMEHDRYIVRWEKYAGGLYLYTKRGGTKHYLTQFEIGEFAKTVKWLIEQHGCDFGEDVNNMAKFAA